MDMKVTYQSITFFNKLLEYVQNCHLDNIDNRSENDYILFFIEVKSGKEQQDISITVENNKDSNIEVLFFKNKNISDRLLIVNPFSKSFSIVQEILAVCSERTMSTWLSENRVLNIL